jgi:hypothetical protein
MPTKAVSLVIRLGQIEIVGLMHSALSGNRDCRGLRYSGDGGLLLEKASKPHFSLA